MYRLIKCMHARGLGLSHLRENAKRRVAASLLLLVYLNTALAGCMGGESVEEKPRTTAVTALTTSPSPPVPGSILPTETDANGVVSGGLAGSAGVSMTGAATYSIPLWTPPARAGIGPNLSLNYSSQSGVGMAGFGWDVSGVSKITRCGKSIAQDGINADPSLDDGPQGDRYCLDGQRLVVVSGAYGTEGSEYRTEFNGHEKIVALSFTEAGPSIFKVYQRDGTVRTYGPIDPGFKIRVDYNAQTDVYTNSVVKYVRFEWGLARVEDTMGNYMAIDYSILGGSQAGAEILPTEIRYTGSVGGISKLPTRRVVFEYENDPFITDRWISGYKLRHAKRLKKVLMYGPAPEEMGLLREYQFTYRTGYHSRETASLLTGISECNGESPQRCKEGIDFEYDIPPAAIRSVPVSFDFPKVTAGRAQCYFGDLDGDGRDDVLYKEGDNRYHYRLSTGVGFGPSNLAEGINLSIGSVTDSYYGLQDTLMGEGSPLVDIDRDGRADLMLTAYLWGNQSSYSTANHLYLNKTNASTGKIQFSLSYSEQMEPRRMKYWRIVDLDGDGDLEYVGYDELGTVPGIVYRKFMPGVGMGGPLRLTDWPAANPRRDFQSFLVGREGRIGYGDGRFAVIGPGGLERVDGYSGRRSGQDYFYPMDVNGDGLQDYLILNATPISPYSTACYSINTGNGYEEPVCSQVGPYLPLAQGAVVADLNRDGRDEFYQLSQPGAYTAAAWSLDQNGDLWTVYSRDVDSTIPGKNPTRVADMNGDGVPDTYACGHSSIQIDVSTGSQQPLLVKVRQQSAFNAFEYGHTGDRTVYTPTEHWFPQQDIVPMHRGVWVVKRATDGLGSVAYHAMNYGYAGSRMSLIGRGWLGFMERVVTDEVTGAKVTTTMQTGTMAKIALPDAERTEISIDGVRHSNSRSWSFTFLQDGTNRLSRVSSSESFCIKNPDVVEDCYRYTQGSSSFDEFGNLTSASNQVMWDGKMRRHQSVHVYEAPDVGRWLVSRPSEVRSTWTDSDGRTSAQEIKYTSSPITGLVEEETRAPNSNLGSEWLKVRISYNEFGLPTAMESRDLQGKVRSWGMGYEAMDVIFPSWEEAGGVRTEQNYHRGLGVLMRVLDGNGDEATFSYDGFGRERIMDVMGLGDRLTSYERRQGGGGIFTRRVVGGQTYRTEMDALGRPVVQQWLRGGSQSEPVYVQTEYKADGKVWRVSQPHTASETPLYTYFDEDAMGRPTKLTRLDGSFRTWDYEQLTSELTDEMGRRHRTTLDGSGQVVSESELLPTGTTTTSYVYGVRGELLQVRDTKGNITSLEYDALGRQTALVDGNQGRVEVGFNAFNEVIRRVDALGVTTIERDRFGRPEVVTALDGATRYTWDGAVGAHGRGKLESIVSPDGVRTDYQYDSIGRPSVTTWSVQGQQFSLEATYDDYGRPLTLSYPTVGAGGNSSRLVVQKTYDDVGNLASIRNAATGFSYWKALDRNSLGQIPWELYGNGVSARKVFDKTGTLRFMEASGLSQVQKLAFRFTADGNLTERHDLIVGTSEDFEYDDADQLSAWKVTQRGAISRHEFAYDSIGNLKTHRIVAGPGFTSTFGHYGVGPHAVTSQTQKGQTRQLQYDAVGNQTDNGKGQTIEYTSFDLPFRVLRGQDATCYKYDGAHRRVLKILPNGDETLTLADVYERRVQAGSTDHVFNLKAEGGLIAQVYWHEGSVGAIEGEQVFYVHSDPLGSPSAITDAQGYVVDRMKFAPFGGRQAVEDLAQEAIVSSFSKIGFQGHSVDDESQFVNMKGRIYDPALGAFLTPDPFVSISLNRYRFGLNNPFKYTDPSGFSFVGWGLSVLRTIGGGGVNGGGGLSPNPIPSHYDSVDWNYGSSHGGGTSNSVNTGSNSQPSSTPRYANPGSALNVPSGGMGDAGGGVGLGFNVPIGSWASGFGQAAGDMIFQMALGEIEKNKMGAGAFYALEALKSYQAFEAKGLDYGTVGALTDTLNPAGRVMEHGWMVGQAYEAGDQQAVGRHVFQASIAAVQTVLLAAGLAGGVAGAQGVRGASAATAEGEAAALAARVPLTSVTDELVARANQLHSVLDPIAQGMRTTTVVRAATVDVVAAGGRDLTRAQLAALNSGEVAAELAGAHAEMTGLHKLVEMGLSPVALGVSREICPVCRLVIEASGGVLDTPFSAVWPNGFVP